MSHVDLNSDVGESFGNWQLGDDAGILRVVTSANIACGFHAGDPWGIQQTVREAAVLSVKVGAQIGYRDLAGFGRRFIDYAPAELAAETLYQLGALQALAVTAGTEISYVKPHGALYNTMVTHQEQARAVIDAVADYNESAGTSLPILLLPGSYAFGYAQTVGMRAVGEVFADRSYHPDGTLVSRKEPDAVIHQTEAVVENMLRLVEDGVVIARDGTKVEVEAQSICTHGDTPGAVQTATAVRAALEDAGVEIRSFV